MVTLKEKALYSTVQLGEENTTTYKTFAITRGDKKGFQSKEEVDAFLEEMRTK